MSKLLELREGRMFFERPLLRGRIVNRPNRFIVNVELEGKVVRCHCPSTGSIGGLTLDGLPCLISGPYELGARSTGYTMEAFAVVEEEHEDFQWVGINQTAVNRYIEGALESGALSPMLKLLPGTLKREVRLGASRLDFKVNGNTFIEVKTPLKVLQLTTPPSLPRKADAASPVERMLKQIHDIEEALSAGEKALLVVCFLYDNPGFLVPKVPGTGKVAQVIAAAKSHGLETWQVNFKLTPEEVQVTKVVPTLTS